MSEAGSVPNSPTPLPPNEELASVIAAALGAAGLIAEEKVDRVRQELAAGSLKEEDWRFLIEDALPEAETEDGDEQGN